MHARIVTPIAITIDRATVSPIGSLYSSGASGHMLFRFKVFEALF